MQIANMPLVIKSIIVMPIATQNRIKPSILFILNSHLLPGAANKRISMNLIDEITDVLQYQYMHKIFPLYHKRETCLYSY